jgi:hypothetical protein
MRILIHFSICIIFGLLLREDPKPDPAAERLNKPHSDSLQMQQAQDSVVLLNRMPYDGQEWARR